MNEVPRPTSGIWDPDSSTWDNATFTWDEWLGTWDDSEPSEYSGDYIEVPSTGSILFLFQDESVFLFQDNNYFMLKKLINQSEIESPSSPIYTNIEKPTL